MTHTHFPGKISLLLGFAAFLASAPEADDANPFQLNKFKTREEIHVFKKITIVSVAAVAAGRKARFPSALHSPVRGCVRTGAVAPAPRWHAVLSRRG